MDNFDKNNDSRFEPDISQTYELKTLSREAYKRTSLNGRDGVYTLVTYKYHDCIVLFYTNVTFNLTICVYSLTV